MYTVIHYSGTLEVSKKKYKTKLNAWKRVLKLAEENTFSHPFIDYVKDDGQKARYTVENGKPVRIR